MKIDKNADVLVLEMSKFKAVRKAPSRWELYSPEGVLVSHFKSFHLLLKRIEELSPQPKS